MTRKLAIVPLLALLALTAGCATPEVGPPVEAGLSMADPESAALIRDLVAHVRAAPREAARRGALGMAYDAAGMIGSAVTCYEQANVLDPSEPRWLDQLAHVQARLGDLAGALGDVDRAIRLEGDYAPARLQRAEWLIESGRIDEAAAAFERVLELEGDHPGAYLGLARVHLERQEVAEALTILERLSRGREHPYLYRLLAEAFRLSGDTDRAAAAEARAGGIDAPPVWSDPWREELDDYRRGVGASVRQAQTLLGQGRFDEAAALLESVLSRDPNHREALVGLALACQRTGRFEQEMNLWHRAVDVHPRDYALQLRVADAHFRRGDREGLLKHLDRAVELEPDRVEAWWRRGRYLSRGGALDEAAAAYDEALRREQGEAALWFDAGALQAQRGAWQSAADHFARAVAIEPRLVAAHIGLGGSQAELGDYAAAAAALEQAARLDPDSARLSATRARLEELRVDGS